MSPILMKVVGQTVGVTVLSPVLGPLAPFATSALIFLILAGTADADITAGPDPTPSGSGGSGRGIFDDITDLLS